MATLRYSSCGGSAVTVAGMRAATTAAAAAAARILTLHRVGRSVGRSVRDVESTRRYGRRTFRSFLCRCHLPPALPTASYLAALLWILLSARWYVITRRILAYNARAKHLTMTGVINRRSAISSCVLFSAEADTCYCYGNSNCSSIIMITIGYCYRYY